MSAPPVPDPETAVAHRALGAYGLPPDTGVELLHRSENATYLLDPSGAERSVLRVYRAGYHRPGEVTSELDWMAALHATGMAVPTALRALDGRRVVAVQQAGQTRLAVRFSEAAGTEQTEDRCTADHFGRLGSITARLHDHARRWRRPPGFTRFSWDWEHTLGAAPRWGDWRGAAGVGAAETAVLCRAQDLLARRLAGYGADADRYGLIHADLRATNLLVARAAAGPEQITVIDFDDCGFGWLLYDFAASVSFAEDHPDLLAWQSAWLEGYRGLHAPPPDAEAMMASFVLLRRLLLLAWMSTRTDTREAAANAASFAAGSATLGEAYLRTAGRALA